MPQPYVPENKLYSKADIEHYHQVVLEFKTLAKQLSDKNLESIKISTAGLKLIKLNGPDVFAIFTNHGLRHMDHTELIIRHSNFPRN